jgi:hypothetical protein
MERRQISIKLSSGEFNFKWKGTTKYITYLYESHKELIEAIQKGIQVECRFFMMHLLALQKDFIFPVSMQYTTPIDISLCSKIAYLRVVGSDFDNMPYDNKGQWLINLDDDDIWWGMTSQGPLRLNAREWIEKCFKGLLEELAKSFHNEIFDHDIRIWGLHYPTGNLELTCDNNHIYQVNYESLFKIKFDALSAFVERMRIMTSVRNELAMDPRFKRGLHSMNISMFFK